MKTNQILKYAFLIFAILISQSILAKTIEGWVFDQSNSKLPLIGVNIYWSGTTDGTITNAEGYFKLPKSANENILVFSYVGYQTDSIKILNETTLTIYLKQGSDLTGYRFVPVFYSGSAFGYLDTLKPGARNVFQSEGRFRSPQDGYVFHHKLRIAATDAK